MHSATITQSQHSVNKADFKVHVLAKDIAEIVASNKTLLHLCISTLQFPAAADAIQTMLSALRLNRTLQSIALVTVPSEEDLMEKLLLKFYSRPGDVPINFRLPARGILQHMKKEFGINSRIVWRKKNKISDLDPTSMPYHQLLLCARMEQFDPFWADLVCD